MFLIYEDTPFVNKWCKFAAQAGLSGPLFFSVERARKRPKKKSRSPWNRNERGGDGGGRRHGFGPAPSSQVPNPKFSLKVIEPQDGAVHERRHKYQKGN
jgi:hypothetical protein